MDIPDSAIWPKAFDFLPFTPEDISIFSEALGPDTEDVTESSINELVDFTPYVRLIGLNVMHEKPKNPCELFYRAVEYTGRNERCLQYVYIYDRQQGFVELESIGMIAYLLVRFLVLLFLDFYVDTKSVILTVLLGVYLTSFGGLTHIEDSTRIRKGLRFRPRERTPFLFIGIVHMFYWINPVIFLCVYVILCAFLILLFAAERMEKGPTAHNMDYAPVFVYIKKDSLTNTWKFNRACWDKYHYYVDGYEIDAEQDQRLMNQKKIMLEIDNLWHDFAPFHLNEEERFRSKTPKTMDKKIKQAQSMERKKLMPFYMSFMILIIGVYLTLEGNLFGPFLILVSESIVIATCFFYFIYLKTKNDEKTQIKNYSTSLKIGLKELHLCHTKLLILWNLKEKKMRLKITKVMQNPFLKGPRCFDRFSPGYFEKLFIFGRRIRDR